METTNTLTVEQRDALTNLARRLAVASLAANALGADAAHDAVAGTIHDVAHELETFVGAGSARRVVARRRIGRAS